MPLLFRLNLAGSGEGGPRVCEGEFPDDVWSRLRTFRNESARLQACEWVTSGMSARLHIKADTSGFSVQTPDRPRDAQVSEVLMRLRPFLLEREPAFFFRIANDLGRYLHDEWLHEQLRRARLVFEGKDQAELYSLTRNSLTLNTADALDLWLNAFEFHRDADKYARFVAEAGGEPGELDLAIFRSLLVGKVEAILYLDRLIGDIELARIVE